MKESVRIGRIGGIPIGFNWSLLLIFWLITWGLATARLPAEHPGHPSATYWTAGVITAVMFFASLVAHELGHALMARRLGMRVRGITLLGRMAACPDGRALVLDSGRLVGIVAPTGVAKAIELAALRAPLTGPAVAAAPLPPTPQPEASRSPQ